MGHLHTHVLSNHVKVVHPPRARVDMFPVMHNEFKNVILEIRPYRRLLGKKADGPSQGADSWEMNVYRNVTQFRLRLPTEGAMLPGAAR